SYIQSVELIRYRVKLVFVPRQCCRKRTSYYIQASRKRTLNKCQEVSTLYICAVSLYIRIHVRVPHQTLFSAPSANVDTLLSWVLHVRLSNRLIGCSSPTTFALCFAMLRLAAFIAAT